MNSTMDREMQRSVAVSCIEKAFPGLGNKATSKFSLLVKEPSNSIMKIDTIYVKQVLAEKFPKNFDEIRLMNTSWGDFIDADGISIAEGNKPIDILNWIHSPADEGLAIIISSDSDMTVIVTIPNENNATVTDKSMAPFVFLYE